MELNTYFCHIYKAIKRNKNFSEFFFLTHFLNCILSRANSYFYKTQYFPICIRWHFYRKKSRKNKQQRANRPIIITSNGWRNWLRTQPNVEEKIIICLMFAQKCLRSLKVIFSYYVYQPEGISFVSKTIKVSKLSAAGCSNTVIFSGIVCLKLL